jgi:potassium-dependent mechanosensitive channel
LNAPSGRWQLTIRHVIRIMPGMLTSIRRFFLVSFTCALLALGVSSAHAQSPASSSSAAPASASSTQDPAQALVSLSKQLDSIKTTLSSKSTTSTALADLRTQAGTVQQQAGQWVDALTPQMDSVQSRLTVLGPPPAAGAPPETAAVSQQRRQLQRDKGKLDGEIKQAQLLGQDAAKLTTEIAETRNEQFQMQLATRAGSPLSIRFWSDLAHAFPDDSARMKRVGGLFADGIASAWQPDNRTPFILCLLGAVLLIVPGRQLAERLTFALGQRYMPDGHFRRSALALLFTLTVTLSIGLAVWLLYLGLNWNDTLDEDLDTLGQSIIRGAFLAAFVAGLGRALLSYRHPSWRLPNLMDATAHALRWFPWLLGGSFLLLVALQHLNEAAGSSLPAAVCTRALLALLISGLIGAALRRVKQIKRSNVHEHEHKPGKHALWVGALAGLATVAVVVAWLSVLAGYIAFAFFISWQMLWIGMIVASLYILTHLQHDLFETLLNPKGRSGHRMQSAFNISPSALEQSSIILSAVCRVLLLLVAVGTLLMPFGGGPNDMFSHIANVFVGLKVGELTIKPGAIFNALVVFIAGVIVVRIIKRWLSEQLLPKTRFDLGMQMSIVTLLNYVAMVIVVALALKTADVSLQSLTWIASALSVGIGFGLQAIVSNFISGLILLAEQPIKVGDWVSMSGVEGDVKRINVRATEIQLWDRSTMIVPNSQFITQNLRNVTHGNALGRVKITLPMPLGTDAAKMREIMMEALTANPETLETPAPYIRLDDVTSSAMSFSGVAYVRSPRDASAVKSDLLFDMLSRLEKAQLPLSTPQSMIVRNLGPLGEDSPAAPG